MPTDHTTSKFVQLPIALIDIPPEQAIRLDEDVDEVSALARLIAKDGLINPITVSANGDRYKLIAGGRRLRAHLINGSDEILVHIMEADQRQSAALTLTENIARRQLSPVEEASALQAIIDTHDPDIQTLSAMVGHSASWIEGRLELLRWPPALQQAVHQRKLSSGAARILAKLPNGSNTDDLISHAIHHGITTQTATLWLQQARSEPCAHVEGEPLPPPPTPTTPQYQTMGVCTGCKTNIPLHAVQRLNFCESCASQIITATTQNIENP